MASHLKDWWNSLEPIGHFCFGLMGFTLGLMLILIALVP